MPDFVLVIVSPDFPLDGALRTWIQQTFRIERCVAVDGPLDIPLIKMFCQRLVPAAMICPGFPNNLSTELGCDLRLGVHDSKRDKWGAISHGRYFGNSSKPQS